MPPFMEINMFTGIIIALIVLQIINIIIQKVRKPAEDSDIVEFRNSSFVLALGIACFIVVLVLLALPHLEQYTGPLMGTAGEYIFLLSIFAISSLLLVMAYAGERIWVTKDEIISRNLLYMKKTVKRSDITSIEIKRNAVVLYSGENKVLSVSSVYDNYMRIVYMLDDAEVEYI